MVLYIVIEDQLLDSLLGIAKARWNLQVQIPLGFASVLEAETLALKYGLIWAKQLGGLANICTEGDS